MKIKNVYKIHLKYNDFYESDNYNVVKHIIKIRKFKNRSSDDTNNIIRLTELLMGNNVITLFINCLHYEFYDICFLIERKIDLKHRTIQNVVMYMFCDLNKYRKQINNLIDLGFDPKNEKYENGLETEYQKNNFRTYYNNFNEYTKQYKRI